MAYGYYNKLDYFKTFSKRIRSVLVPFLLAHVVYMVGDALFGIPFGVADVLNSLIGKSTLVRNDWYVPICLLFYILFWAIYRCRFSGCLKQLILVSTVCVYVYVFSVVLKLGTFWWMNALSFFGGVWWQSICEREKTSIISTAKRKDVWIRRVAACIIGYILAYIGVPISYRIFGTYAYEICYNLMSLFGVGLIVLLFSVAGGGNRVTAFIASISYEIYLYHGLFIDGLRSGRIYINNDTIYVVGVFVATIALSVLVHFLTLLVTLVTEGRGLA